MADSHNTGLIQSMGWLVVVVVSDDMLYMFTLKFNLTYTILMGVEIVSLLARIGGCESDSYKYTYS